VPPPPEHAAPDPAAPPQLAIVGRPNAGKSTLINRLLGTARLIASGVPGTTRDRVRVPLEFAGRSYVLLDTPGVRRRARISGTLEKLSVVKALQAIEDADVSVLLLDASVGPTEQDARLAAYAGDHARALVLAVNKADLLTESQRRAAAAQIERTLPFLTHVPRRFVSAHKGTGLRALVAEVDAVHARAGRELPTATLTRAVQELVRRNPPPLVGTWRPRLRYAHPGGRRPVTVVIHGTRLAGLPASYLRYLENGLRESLDLAGVPLRLVLRQGENPYAPPDTG
jgi:GTPase